MLLTAFQKYSTLHSTMIDTAQTLLLIVVVVLTVLLLVLGVQVYFILAELRKTIMKANKVLDDASIITESISEPVAAVSNIVSGFKTGAMIASFFNKHKKQKEEGKEDEGE